jgi:hypothetical protein
MSGAGRRRVAFRLVVECREFLFFLYFPGFGINDPTCQVVSGQPTG